MNGWYEAYLAQARSDFLAAEVLRDRPLQRSQATMLLQKAWENLAKAALAKYSKFDPNRANHFVATRFVRGLKLRQNANTFGMRQAEFRSRVRELAKQLNHLERLIPRRPPNRPNTEYPWLTESGDVRWPARSLTRKFTSSSDRALSAWKDFAWVADRLDNLVV